MIVINSKAMDRFQEPEYPQSVCCMCGKTLDVEETYSKDDKDYCECCYDDQFVTV